MKSAAELQALANLAEERGDYAKAARLHEKALVKKEKQLGQETPELYDYLYNVGMIRCALDKRVEAEESFNRLLQILLAYFPEEHGDILEIRSIIEDIHTNEEIATIPLAVTA